MTATHVFSETPQIHYSREDAHGDTWPIKVWETPSGKRRFEVERPNGEAKRFSTVKDTLAELHRGAYQTWGWERYAQCGRWAPTPILGEPEITVTAVFAKPLDPGLQTIVVSPKTRRGVDLKNRHHEVAKLLYAGFGAQIHANGYDFEDVLQEVFRKLMVSNRGKSPWDPTKSSFGHFVYMVCRSTLYNLYRKDRRRRDLERLGGYTARDGDWVAVDLADRADLSDPTVVLEYPDEALDDLSAHLYRCAGKTPRSSRARVDADLAVQALPYVREGYGRGEIAHLLGLDPPLVSRGLAYLRKHASTW